MGSTFHKVFNTNNASMFSGRMTALLGFHREEQNVAQDPPQEAAGSTPARGMVPWAAGRTALGAQDRLTRRDPKSRAN